MHAFWAKIWKSAKHGSFVISCTHFLLPSPLAPSFIFRKSPVTNTDKCKYKYSMSHGTQYLVRLPYLCIECTGTSNKPIWHPSLCRLRSKHFCWTMTTADNSSTYQSKALYLSFLYIAKCLGIDRGLSRCAGLKDVCFLWFFAAQFIWHTSYVRIHIIIYYKCSNTIARWRTLACRENKRLYNLCHGRVQQH